MITVTNPRVAGFSPRWSSFRGLTLLFDNPSTSLAEWQGLQRVACDVASDPSLEFYRVLRGGLEEIGIDMLTETYLFCPLTPASYHVTAWDCVNDGNAAQVHTQHRSELTQILNDVPAALAQPNSFTALAQASTLLTKHDWNIRFRFDRLVKWRNSVLVAQLRPADEDAVESYQAFTQARDQLNKHFRHTFGIGASEIYRPHATLGYFANVQAAQLATPCIDDWSSSIAARMDNLTLTFASVSLYGFTDLETFFRMAA